MTIINKPDFNIFASEAKSGEVTTFPNLLRGWGVTIDQTAGKPPMEWFNALQKRTDEWLTYLSQRGLPEWQNTLDYPKDAVVQFGGKFYVAKKNTKNAQPDRSQNDWAVMLGSAASRDVGTGKGNVMEVGAFGIGGGGFEFNYTNNADLMAALRAKGSCIFRNTKDGTAMSSWAPGLFAHAGDANCMITINPFTGNVIAAGFTDGNKDSPKVNTLYGTANKPTAADVGAYSKEDTDKQFEALVGERGYQKLPSGLIIQWGAGTINSTSGHVSFSYPFKTAPFLVSPTKISSQNRYVTAANYTSEGFDVYGWISSGAGNVDSFRYIAFGI